ncbi:MAG: hypothetical protein QW130_01110 [Sulfolobales archaeon]
MLRALGAIKSSRVCKPMSTYRCFGDPGIPRPTADRGRGLRETVVTRSRKTYRNLGWETVKETSTNEVFSAPIPSHEA